MCCVINVWTACWQGAKCIQWHFSFLYPNLHRVNKVITTKREFLCFLFCLCCTDTPDGCVSVSVCVCDQCLGGNHTTITLVHLVKQQDIGISVESWSVWGSVSDAGRECSTVNATEMQKNLSHTQTHSAGMSSLQGGISMQGKRHIHSFTVLRLDPPTTQHTQSVVWRKWLLSHSVQTNNYFH